MEVDEYNDPMPMPHGTAFQTPLDNLGSTILKLTNTEDEIRYLEMTLRGEYEDSEGTTIKFCDPMMNEIGITTIMRLVRSVVSRVTVMSNLDREIPNLMGFLSENLIENLMLNSKRYGIKDPSTRSDISFIVQFQAFMAMRRAYKEGDKRFLKGSTQDIRTQVTSDTKRGSLMSKFMNWNK